MISDQVPYAKLEEAVQRIEMCSELSAEERDVAAHFLLSHPIACVVINTKHKDELPRYLRSLKSNFIIFFLTSVRSNFCIYYSTPESAYCRYNRNACIDVSGRIA